VIGIGNSVVTLLWTSAGLTMVHVVHLNRGFWTRGAS